MKEVKPRSSRREQILQALARMLETHPGSRITTAKLAQEVGVSEAALYRHFPSKARMFEGLIEFAEEAVFSRISRILDEESGVIKRCEKILVLILNFCEKNPGITEILMGNALLGETPRLQQRVNQFFDRIESQLRQIIKEAELREGMRPTLLVNALANLLLASIEGRLHQFVRSGYKQLPMVQWSEQWKHLSAHLFHQ